MNIALALFLTIRKGVDQRGENLKGKARDKGICQRKDDLYSVRHLDAFGNTHQKDFPALSATRKWLEESKNPSP